MKGLLGLGSHVAEAAEAGLLLEGGRRMQERAVGWWVVGGL